jgi:hypothetical protein
MAHKDIGEVDGSHWWLLLRRRREKSTKEKGSALCIPVDMMGSSFPVDGTDEQKERTTSS